MITLGAPRVGLTLDSCARRTRMPSSTMIGLRSSPTGWEDAQVARSHRMPPRVWFRRSLPADQ